MLLAGGRGDTNGKPQIDKTSHLKEAYEFWKTVYEEYEQSDLALVFLSFYISKRWEIKKEKYYMESLSYREKNVASCHINFQVIY